MDPVQRILGSIHNRIYIWQYGEYKYPMLEEYMFDTPGKDISKITDRHIWVLGQHIFFTPVSHFHENAKRSHFQYTHHIEMDTEVKGEMEEKVEVDEEVRVYVCDRTSGWEEFRGLEELADLTASKSTSAITWDDIHTIHLKSKNAN